MSCESLSNTTFISDDLKVLILPSVESIFSKFLVPITFSDSPESKRFLYPLLKWSGLNISEESMCAIYPMPFCDSIKFKTSRLVL